MIKSKTHILCFMLIICSVCQAQKLSIKPYFIYHQSMSEQDELWCHYDFLPFLLDSYLPLPWYSYLPLPASENFNLATNTEYGFVIDYRFRNQLGFELGLGYSNVVRKNLYQFGLDERNYVPYLIDWNYQSLAVRPLFSYAVINGKAAFISKIGPVIHYVSAARNTFFMNEKLIACTFSNQLNWGYTTALEYNYQLLKRLSLAVELGLEQYKYTPQKASIEYGELIVPGGMKEEIIYVDGIIKELVEHYPFQNKMLKQSILFNNIYFGIGIKYNL